MGKREESSPSRVYQFSFSDLEPVYRQYIFIVSDLYVIFNKFTLFFSY